MNSESLVNAIFAKDGQLAADAFQGAIANKIADALEVKKVEIASNFISAPAEMNTDDVTTYVEPPTEAQIEA